MPVSDIRRVYANCEGDMIACGGVGDIKVKYIYSNTLICGSFPFVNIRPEHISFLQGNTNYVYICLKGFLG